MFERPESFRPEDGFEILEEKIPSGSKRLRSLQVGETADSREVVIPVGVVVGKKPGPVLFCSGAIHGNEVIGAFVLRRVLSDLRAEDISGVFVTTPIANAPTFILRNRLDVSEFPSFVQDLNRVFPGRVDGTLTERIAFNLMDKLVSKADYCIDIHSSGLGGLWSPYGHVLPAKDFPKPQVLEKTIEMAQAFGVRFVVKDYPLDGSLIWAAVKRGKPAIIAEFGPVMKYDRGAFDLGVRGVANVMKKLGMMDGYLEKPEQEQVVIKKLIPVNANHGGFLERKVESGEKASSGQTLAEISDWTGKVLETVRAPTDCYVLRIADLGVAKTGDRIANLGVAE